MPSGLVCHPLAARKRDQNSTTPQNVVSSSEDAPMATSCSPLPSPLPPPLDAMNRPCVGPALHEYEEEEKYCWMGRYDLQLRLKINKKGNGRLSTWTQR